MRAVVVRGPGRFGLEEVPEPNPGEYDALVRISHCGICTGTDRHLIAGPSASPHIQPYPTILGHESIGQVVEVGPQVRHLKVGDRVLRPAAVRPGEYLGGYSGSFGGMAQLGLATDAQAIVEDTPHQQKPALPPLSVAQQVVPEDFDPVGAGIFITFKETLSWAQDLGVGPGARVAVIGTGGVGLCLVRVCKLLGAETVVAVGRRPWPLRRALEMGANHVAGLPGEPPGDMVEAATAGRGCTHVVDAVGHRGVLQQGLGLLAPGGRLGQYGVPPRRDTHLDWTNAPPDSSLHFASPQEDRVHNLALEWLRLGLFDPLSLVDLVLPLEEVEEAFAILEAGYASRATLALSHGDR